MKDMYLHACFYANVPKSVTSVLVFNSMPAQALAKSMHPVIGTYTQWSSFVHSTHDVVC